MSFPRSKALQAVWLIALFVSAAAGQARAGVQVGNVVFRDQNANRRFDVGEGMSGVTVQLFSENHNPLTSTPAATTITATDGTYRLTAPAAGNFFAFIPPSAFVPGAPLAGAYSLPGVQQGTVDDDAGEDGFDDPEPAVNGISTRVMTLATGSAPGPEEGETGHASDSDDATEGDVDLTIDLGFYLPVGVGNLVFADRNGNGHADAGEGIPGVQVRLHTAYQDIEADLPVAQMRTDSQGRFLFEDLIEGDYRLMIPSVEFAAGGPLFSATPLPGTTPDTDDDTGEDSQFSQLAGVLTDSFNLTAGAAPTVSTNETGLFSAGDDARDDSFDLTRDFGFTSSCPVITLTPGTLTGITAGEPVDQSFFANGGTLPYTWTTVVNLPTGLSLSPTGRLTGTIQTPGRYELRLRATDFHGCTGNVTVIQNVTAQTLLSAGNLIFIDQNRNGRADDGEGVPNVIMRLYQEGMNPLTAPPVVNPVTTNTNGRYLFENLGPGRFFVHVTAAQFLEGAPLYQHISMPGAGTDNGHDDDVDENGIDAALPASVGISSSVFTLAANTEPTNATTETGLGNDLDLGMDNDGDLTIDLGFVPLPSQGLQIGNLVYVDADGDNRADAGEGANGVTAQLFVQGENPQSAFPRQSQITSGGGFYRFSGLTPGNYFVHIPAPNFQTGGALLSHTSVTGFGLDVAVDDDADENGIDAPNPASTGVSSIFINLGYYLEAKDVAGETGLGTVVDNADDANGNMTVDFGFRRLCPALAISPNGGSFNGMQALPFAQSFTASGGTEPYVFSVVGSLPQGLTLSAAGLLSGTPTNAGTSTFSVRATDAHACTATVSVSFTAAPAPPGTTIGNLVFIDTNANGVADAGEGVAAVRIHLKSATGVTIAQTTTDTNGLYAFEDVPPGSYYVEIPASMFASTAPLGGMKSLPGVVATGDDDVSEDGMDSVDVRVSGVRTGDLALAIGTAPTSATGESGLGAASDDARDLFTDLTIDLGFTNALPRTFAQWQVENGLNGQNNPNDNPDGDRSSNLMEFALGQNGGSSVEDAQFPGFYIERSAGGTLDAVIFRRAGGVLGMTYAVEASVNGDWTELTIPPVITPQPAGLEEVRLANIEADSQLTGLEGGDVRLHIMLDANGDGQPEAQAVTPVWSWKRRLLAQRAQTFCMPLVRKDVFTGAVDRVVTGTTLDLTTAAGAGSLTPYFTNGLSYYIEVIGGDHEGHRWEIDEAQSSATMLRIDLASLRNTLTTLPTTLAGDLIAIRAHWTFNDLFPPARFSANNRQTTADRAVVLDRATGALREFWLFANNGSPKWVMSGDALLADQGARVVDAAEGLFLHARGTPVSLPQAGVTRTNAFVVRLRAGLNMVGGGWAVPQSPADRVMTAASGFTAHANAATADRLHVWRGDFESIAAYTSYTFMNFRGGQFWDMMGDADLVDSNTDPLFEAFRAIFIISRAGNTTWTLQPPSGP